jgi:hypothetical protein
MTNRKNTGELYHGCLRIEVRRSVDLYMSIEGWASAAMSSESDDRLARIMLPREDSNLDYSDQNRESCP